MTPNAKHAADLGNEINAELVLVLTKCGDDIQTSWNIRQSTISEAISSLASSLVHLYKLVKSNPTATPDNLLAYFLISYRLGIQQEFPNEIKDGESKANV